MKSYHLFICIVLMLSAITSHSQINFKKKAEKKADQVIDDFLFGKKKKQAAEPSAPSTPLPPSSPESEPSGTEPATDYTPQPVDWANVDFGETTHFRILIDMLPESIYGFNRSEKPEGAMYSNQGLTYSTGMKTYRKDGRELLISLSDYLNAEYLVGAQSQQYAYESTDGFVKSFEAQEMTGWITMEYEDQEGSVVAIKAGRFLVSINVNGTNESELRAIFNELDFSNLPVE